MKKSDAEVLRSIRQALKLSTDELAAEIDLPAPLLEGWEAGTTKPRAGLWRSIVELIADRGRVILDSEAEAADRIQRSKEKAREAQIAAIAAEMNAARPPRRRRLKS